MAQVRSTCRMSAASWASPCSPTRRCTRARLRPRPRQALRNGGSKEERRINLNDTLALWAARVLSILRIIAALIFLTNMPVPLVFVHFGGARAELGVEQPGFTSLLELVR